MQVWWPSGKERRIQTRVFLISKCGRVTLVSLSKTLNHCFVLQMGRKAVGPMCCVTHVKEPSALIEKKRGFAPLFLVNPCKPLKGAI